MGAGALRPHSYTTAAFLCGGFLFTGIDSYIRDKLGKEGVEPTKPKYRARPLVVACLPHFFDSHNFPHPYFCFLLISFCDVKMGVNLLIDWSYLNDKEF